MELVERREYLGGRLNEEDEKEGKEELQLN